MQKQIFKIFFLLAIFFSFPYCTMAGPVINSLEGSFLHESSLIINGSGFGAKNNAAPVYWNNLENETEGINIPGWSISSQPGPVVTTNDKWSGNKSLHFAFKNNSWNQILRDMGPSPRWFFHYKVRMNKNDTNSRFQWKSWRISSSPDGYAWNAQDDTAVMLNDWWWRTAGWFNTSTFTYFNNAGSPAATSASLNSSNAILLNQWQTMEQFIRMSSAPLVADGVTHVWRDGNLILTKSDHVTHDEGSGQWRYMLLGQSINNELDADGFDANGINDVDLFYDDIYVDNSQAKVQICLGSQWNIRGICEIQIPQNVWSGERIDIEINQGNFANGSQQFLYIMDEDGNVNADGYPITFNAGTDLTAPASPSGLSVL